MAPLSIGQRFIASESYQRARRDGAFANGRLPDEVRSIKVADEGELRGAINGLRARTYADLTSFDIEGVPQLGSLPATGLLPARVEWVPVDKVQVLLGQELSETALAQSAKTGQPLPEADINFGALNEQPQELYRFGTGTPVSLGMLDEPGIIARLLDERFEMGFTLGLEKELLLGNGLTWTGLVNMATTATGDASHAISYALVGGQYRSDAICRAIAKVQANGWYVRPLQIVSHPETRADVYTERATDGLPVPVREMIDQTTDAWLVSKFMAAGKALVLDAFGAVAVLQKGDLSIELAPNQNDFLARGLVELKLETRLWAWPKQPPAVAIVTGL